MADSDLPVFSFRPNWREPMAERLAFLTDVLRAKQGAEQRRSVRETPRRTFDADFLLVGPERTFWDLFMNSIGGQEFMAPLYWEVVVTPGLTAGVTDRIDFDTTYTEWGEFDGGLALVAGKSALDYEVIEIAGVDANGIDLAVPVVGAWPTGTKLYPLRRSVVDDFGELDHPTPAVALVTARIRIVTANPWTPAMEPAPLYGGLPVLLSEPNWVDDLATSYDRDLAVLDNEVGLTYQRDLLGRFFAQQAHSFFLPGRLQMALFRDLVYRNRGRAGSFWLPTYKADFTLAAPVASGSNQLEVENVGFQYAGGPTSGREYIVIRHASGFLYRQIADVIPGSTAATETLVLDSPVGLDLSPGLVRKISFMDAGRFDADEFEIVHYAGVDGLHTCDTSFRTFKNTRTAPTPIDYPIAETEMTNGVCGIAADEDCYEVPVLPEFEGWYYKAILSMPGNADVPNSSKLIMDLTTVDGGTVLSSLFYYDTTEYQPGGPSRQYCVSADLSEVHFYYQPERGGATQLFLKQQRIGSAGTTVTFKRWNEPFSEPLTTTADSEEGVQSSWGGVGLFPETRYFNL